ncbi:isoflavone reductase family protein [Aspergillus ibericus CBS 121593]|uniref:Isoflavone reductase family protein n=1 Tax=Aspergillus ibericus CBS 121593 TaxID=1448316 RepID=A0A395GUE3_9EURO|nr:isoflavone reductase family protein [Aspergillus ibericus CBS 121593]RAK98287.1 isoflavone reductase family protein [Aspergillus ibericus CBS 121593]
MASTTTRPVVAIAGATGHLGKHVASAFLSSHFSSRFSEIVLLSRQGAQPDVAGPATDIKLTVRQYDEDNLVDALKGVHILVNTVGASGHAFKERLLRALPQTQVEVYFPSEFGVDHYVHDFPHLEWDQKKRHVTLAQQLIPGTKVCRVFCGLFLEDSIGPWFGFDTKDGKYESVGSSQSPVSFTSLGDVGKAVASLAALPKEQIPETVHVAGDTRSISEIASLMGEAGAGQIQVTEIDLQQYKEEATAKESKDPARFLRFLMGENRINHTEAGLGNDDELVNPDQRAWKWETLVDLAKQTHGQPWKDFVWPPQ